MSQCRPPLSWSRIVNVPRVTQPGRCCAKSDGRESARTAWLLGAATFFRGRALVTYERSTRVTLTLCAAPPWESAVGHGAATARSQVQ